MHKTVGRVVAAVGFALLLAACQENLGSGAACPALCPEQSAGVRDTTFLPLSLDSGVVGFPPVGTEPVILLAQRLDSLLAVGVFRFDSLISTFPKPTSGDTTTKLIAGVDSASLVIPVSDTTLASDSATIEVYDVDTAAADFDAEAARPLFRPDRLIAARTFDKDSVTGTLRIVLPAPFVEARVLSNGRIRLGLRVSSSSSVQVRVVSSNGGSPVVLTYRGRSALHTPTSPDTVTFVIGVNTKSTQPGDPAPTDLADYTLVSSSTLPPPPATFAVGGLPATRAYLRFALPVSIVESTTVVRATLELTQVPYRGVAEGDTLVVLPRVVAATPLVEVGKATLLLESLLTSGLPGVALVPRDSGVRRFEIVGLVRRWRFVDTTQTQRAIVLQSSGEGVLPQQIFFFSSEAPVDSLRPRLRISYILRTGSGLP